VSEPTGTFEQEPVDPKIAEMMRQTEAYKATAIAAIRADQKTLTENQLLRELLEWALHGFFLEVNAVRTGLGEAHADLLASMNEAWESSETDASDV
jgi:hypothetical protein